MSQDTRAEPAGNITEENTAQADIPAQREDQPVRKELRDGVEYTLIGTAHVSRASAEAVHEMSTSGDYDAIAVELCQARYDSLTAERKWTDLDLYRIIREGKAGLVLG